ncbi:MAG: HAD-IB family phosphatase [Desulfobacteraceae bacterium]
MEEKGKIISLSATGLDSPGLVAKITTKIFEMNGNIIDVEETCRRGLFYIFLIIDFSASEHSMDAISAALNSIGDETGLKILLDIYEEEEISYVPQKENHIVTVLGEDRPGIIAKISSFFHQYNISIENCRMIARGKFFSMEMAIDISQMAVQTRLSREEAIDKMSTELKELCKTLNQSVVIQSEDIYQRGKKLIVFDVESTLIQDHSLGNFLEKIEGKVGPIDSETKFRDAHEDKIETLIENARVLKGIPISDFDKFGDILELNPGALELIGILKSMGFKIALLTSGFNFFTKKIFEAAGVDYAFSNTLKADEGGIITGELEEPIITSDSKQEILEFVMNVEKIGLDQVIAVGDGSIGSHFIENVGLSIAFKPDENSIKTDGVLSSDRIMNMLYCLGIPKAELDRHLKSGPS